MFASIMLSGSLTTISLVALYVAIIMCSWNSLSKVTIALVPQVPSDITTLPTYDQNRQLSQLIVQWSHEVCCNGILLIMEIHLMIAACVYF